MLTIKHLDHVVLRVTDLRAMMAFYTDVLGCPVEKVQEDLGLDQLRAGSALIDLVPIDGPLGKKGGAAAGVEGRNLDHFCLRVDPFDAECDRRPFARPWCRACSGGVPVWRRGSGAFDLCVGPGRQRCRIKGSAGTGSVIFWGSRGLTSCG